jgi:enamine deaminase RidA (YjgF/YER057c/UK114 family)
MQNMKAVLQEAGMTFEHIVKTTIFIIDMSDFAKINTVYGSYFNEKPLQLGSSVAKNEISMILNSIWLNNN